MNELEISLGNDFDSFEKMLNDSPKDELNKPNKTWNDGNVLHGIMQLTNGKELNGNVPELMKCEYEQWVYLIHKSKEKGVDIEMKNNKNQTPLEYLKEINHNHKELNDIVDILIQYGITYQ